MFGWKLSLKEVRGEERNPAFQTGVRLGLLTVLLTEGCVGAVHAGEGLGASACQKEEV